MILGASVPTIVAWMILGAAGGVLAGHTLRQLIRSRR